MTRPDSPSAARIRPRWMLSLLLGCSLAGCARGADSAPPPRLSSTSGVDPLVLERVQQGLDACARGAPGGLLELAKIYDANDLNQLALEAYEGCLALDPEAAGASQAELHFHRGRALEVLGRSEEAIQAFSAALALEENYVPTHWRRGHLLLESGRIQEARADFERALALEPASVAARLGLGRVQLIEDDPAAVVATLAPVLEREPDERFVHGLLARAHRALGDERRAAEELKLEERAEHVTMADPRAADVRKRATGIMSAVRRANSALVGDKPGEALRVMEPLYARLPGELAVVQMFAKSLVVAGESARALAVLEQGRALHPDDYKLELYTGLALQAQGLAQPGLTHLERSRALNPAYGPTQAAIGEAELKLGRLADAEQSFALALAGQEVELRTFLSLGQTQMRQAAWERASATFERACGQYPDAAAPWVYLAEAQFRRGDGTAAHASLAEAERRNPAHARIAEVRSLLAGAEARPR